jgi:C-terminal peptidase prc
MIVTLCVLTAALPGRAANPGDGSPPGSTDTLRKYSADYAANMMGVIHWVDQRYVRPVSRAALAEAALAGLYEAAREPMPPGLKADVAQAKDDAQFSYLFATARERLGDVEALRGRQAVLASLRSLPRALDPFSGIPGPNDRRDSGKEMTGVGIDFESLPEAVQPQMRVNDPFDRPSAPSEGGVARGPARIALVFPGSPAQRAGLRPGDVLTHIDDHPLETPEGTRLFPQLFSEPGYGHEPLRLTLQRPGQDEPLSRQIYPTKFTPEAIYGVRRRTDNSWDFMLDRAHGIAYLRLGFIAEGADEEMAEAISGLRSSGVRGLVFDLRGNPGGFVDPAKSIGGMFVKSGLVASMHDRTEKTEDFRIENGSGALEGIPTVVLIDGDTRGGGEMVAAVLQDHKVGRIAGQRSFGKGSVQKTYRPGDSETAPALRELGIEFKVTTGSFTRPSGRNLNRFPDSRPQDDWGIRPDPGLEYPITPELAKQLKQWMQLQVLRPGDSRDSLPLDDPENDPPREFARQLLLKKSKS